MHDRRKVLTAIAAGVPVVMFAGCANLTSSQLEQDAQLISSGLSGIVADLANIPNLVPADIMSKINAELNIISQNASQIGSLVGSAPAVAINTAVGVLASLVTPFFPMAPMVAVAVQAAITLAATLIGSLKAGAGPQMSVAQARKWLQAASPN